MVEGAELFADGGLPGAFDRAGKGGHAGADDADVAFDDRPEGDDAVGPRGIGRGAPADEVAEADERAEGDEEAD